MTYTYLAFKRTSAIAVAYFPNTNPDPEVQDVAQALRNGYRWIRTDGDFAIFEKVVGTLTEREAWLLNDVSYMGEGDVNDNQYLELQVLARKLASWRAKQ